MIQWDKNIQDQFNEVIKYSQGIENPQTDKLFEIWSKRKWGFWDSMDKKLIYEFPQPVTLEMDAQTKEDRLSHFLDWVSRFSESLGDFLDAQRDGFYDNKTISNWHTDDDVIPAGMKISKAIGRYWRDYLDPIQIDTVQCEISRMIQENKVTGRLCLSIHPLDYLSLSENQHNWRSCHALDGEYRAGNLSYMLDQTTVIAYIKSDEDTTLPRFPESVPWNNKKWRCLFFVDPGRSLIYAGRQYPFFSENALNLVRQCLLEPCNYFMNKIHTFEVGIPWRHNCVVGDCEVGGEKVYLHQPHIFDANTCVRLSDWVRDEEGSMHFNDLLRSSFYTAWTLRYGHRSDRELLQQGPVVVGDAIPCLVCGDVHPRNEVCNSDVMACEACVLDDPNMEVEWVEHCAECGCRINRDESYCHDGEYYCDNCVDAHTSYCEKCGASILEYEDTAYEGKDGEILCWHCYHYPNGDRNDPYIR